MTDAAKDRRIARKAFAKINLVLDVVGARTDGYHEVNMIMQTVGLYDTVTVTRRGDADIRMTIVFEDAYRAPEELLTADADNLCIRAAREIRKVAGRSAGYDISLVKRIPVGAGLAGGSTDAAAVLMAVNELEELSFSAEELCAMGARLGADIPYCIRGGTKHATGTGTTLADAPEAPVMPILLVKPEVSMPTGGIYRAFDEAKAPFHPSVEDMQKALQSKDRKAIAAALGNTFEPIVAARCPMIGELKKALLEAGAEGAVMTGSGSCVYGIFADESKARDASERISASFSHIFSHVTTTVSQV